MPDVVCVSTQGSGTSHFPGECSEPRGCIYLVHHWSGGSVRHLTTLMGMQGNYQEMSAHVESKCFQHHSHSSYLPPTAPPRHPLPPLFFFFCAVHEHERSSVMWLDLRHLFRARAVWESLIYYQHTQIGQEEVFTESDKRCTGLEFHIEGQSISDDNIHIWSN